ncbi:OmpA family protein [bacterium]|nr:OmpA family protein [bacterium]
MQFYASLLATNWELSTARSTLVVKYLQERGVNPAFLSAAGYSEYRPLDSNDTEEGRARDGTWFGETPCGLPVI